MSQADRDKWQARYTAGRGYQAEPDPYFTEVAARFLPASGRAVDVAGGVGRHARWLAGRGLDVTLADISEAAVARGVAQAAEAGLTLRPCVLDLDDGLPEGPWHVVLVSFFLVGVRLPALVQTIAPGGLLLMVHPTLRNLERHDKPTARYLLPEGAYAQAIEGLETLHREEGWGVRGRHEIRWVARRI